MSNSAAENIIIDGEVLLNQERALEDAAQAAADAAALAQVEISGDGFGRMCAFLPPLMNAMTRRISSAAQETGTLARRMGQGVAAGRADFAEVEERAVAVFNRLEGMA